MVAEALDGLVVVLMAAMPGGLARRPGLGFMAGGRILMAWSRLLVTVVPAS